MERIQRLRRTQDVTLEDFTLDVIDNPKCQFCDSYDECKQYMGDETMEYTGIYGCSAFDTSVEKLKNFYITKYCTIKQG